MKYIFVLICLQADFISPSSNFSSSNPKLVLSWDSKNCKSLKLESKLLSKLLLLLLLFNAKELLRELLFKLAIHSKSLYILLNNGLTNLMPIFIFYSIFIPYSKGITNSAIVDIILYSSIAVLPIIDLL